MKRFKHTIRIVLFSLLGLIPFTFVFSQTVSDGGSWKTGTPMHNLRVGPVAASIGGKIYAIGGMFNWDRAVQNVEAYDPVTKQWTVKGPMLKPRWGHASAVLNGKIYTIGGYFGGGHYASEVEEYDPATDTWRVRASLPVAQVGPAAAALNGKIYAFGGGTDRQGLYEYDPATNKWTPRAHMIKPRYGLAGVALDGKLYAIGGYDQVDETTLASVEEYNPATNTWRMVAPMSVERGGAPAASVFNGKIYVIGGLNSQDDRSTNLSNVEEYDPVTNIWRTMTSMPTARHGLATAVLNNKIYALGGLADPQFLSVVEVFQPPQDCTVTPPVLSALISSKTGSQSARQWTIALTSTCFADNAQIDGLTLTQTFGATCTPIITSPAAFPLKVGDIESHGEASGVATIDFSGCANSARFSAKISFSANDGAAHGSKTLNNQYR